MFLKRVHIVLTVISTGKKKLTWLSSRAQWLKITEKVAFNIASEASNIYIFRGQNFIKSAKNGQFWKMRLFWWFSNTVSKVGWGWDVPKPICWLLSPHQLARWVDGIYAEMQCYQKLQQKCSVLEHQSFCLTSCIFILSEKQHLMFLQSTGQALFPLSAKPLWSRLESRYDHKVYHHAQWVKIP